MDLLTIANVAFAGIAVLGAVLTAIAAVALGRAPSPRMGLVTTGFALVMVQGIIVGVGLFSGGWSVPTLLVVTAIFEAALLIVFFTATVVR
ncbi:MAG: hypothetical protein WCA77_05695 [Thermoplasmata archaeon]